MHPSLLLQLAVAHQDDLRRGAEAPRPEPLPREDTGDGGGWIGGYVTTPHGAMAQGDCA